jgi:hypothetical protein
VEIRETQGLAWENKLVKGFNVTDVPLEFCLLNGELAEAFDAWRKGRGNVAEELADIAIYLFGAGTDAGRRPAGRGRGEAGGERGAGVPAPAQRRSSEGRRH